MNNPVCGPACMSCFDYYTCWPECFKTCNLIEKKILKKEKEPKKMANYVKLEDLRFEDVAAQIRNRNFSGKPTKFDRNGGKRSFSLMFDEETGLNLLNLGWNAKPAVRQDGTTVYYLTIKVSYDHKPPQVYIIREGKPALPIGEDQIGDLDNADLEKVSMIVHPSRFETPDGRVGFSAFLKAMYITLNSDPFATQYGIDPLAGTGFGDSELEDSPF